MRIAISPTTFKGTVGVIDACIAIIKGIRQRFPNADVIQLPVSDGGDGFLESLLFNCGGKFVNAVVTGPRGRHRQTICGILDDGRGVVEMAKASGFAMLEKEERNPLLTTSYGTGELIRGLIARGVQEVVIGVGGSATIDAGMGCMQALGVRFLDQSGKDVEYVGREIGKVTAIDAGDVSEEVRSCRLIIAADVNNVLLGDEGAVFTYGKQKGLKDSDAPFMEDAVAHLAEVIKNGFGTDITTIPGGGAAGGIGAGLFGVLRAEIRDGAEQFFEMSDFRKRIKGAEIIVTGEGRFDSLTGYGKVVQRILSIGRENNMIVVVLAGEITEGAEKLFSDGRSFGIAITPSGMSLSEAKARVHELLQRGSLEAMMKIAKGTGEGAS
jgi:glycerate kinase